MELPEVVCCVTVVKTLFGLQVMVLLLVWGANHGQAMEEMLYLEGNPAMEDKPAMFIVTLLYLPAQ